MSNFLLDDFKIAKVPVGPDGLLRIYDSDTRKFASLNLVGLRQLVGRSVALSWLFNPFKSETSLLDE